MASADEPFISVLFPLIFTVGITLPSAVAGKPRIALSANDTTYIICVESGCAAASTDCGGSTGTVVLVPAPVQPAPAASAAIANQRQMEREASDITVGSRPGRLRAPEVLCCMGVEERP